jgi:hypothetical protein
VRDVGVLPGKMPITLENYWTVGRSLLSLMAKKKVSIKKKKKKIT